ncbi:hypothetical protein [Achromobacter sp. JUb104]|uniref:hypothetical protein n=1 Tax=Achromobacter sp. JUb104 TaxID=2940590 RepID=UPI002168EE0A|nr:hypothetical protein [Achromobacter sp. JUb104]MCS3506963.1 hypothetical protein [Achromobacter sp. JUb104]
MSRHNDIVKRLPRSLLFGAKRFVRRHLASEDVPKGGTPLSEILGIRRVNNQCIELEPYGNVIRNVHANSIGVFFIMGTASSAFIWSITPSPIDIEIWLVLFIAPWAMAAFGGFMYLCTRRLFGKFRGGFIRIHRGTRKLYFVTPRDGRLMTLEWDQIQALAGYIPTIGAAGYSSHYPLYLIAVDWNQTPPKEICVSCGNLGWRDGGVSAKQLWDCLQIFMQHGSDALPEPPSVPPRLSRKQTFLRCYRNWAERFVHDLSTPKGKRWAPLWIPAKVLWLICIVFPDSLAEFIEYNVPYTSFPKEIDALCGFNEKRVPIMRLNGERIDS